ncbi:MAG: alpha/beta hydrolase family protein [Burkholderiaceae bacterium]
MSRREFLLSCLTLTGGSVGLSFAGVAAGAVTAGEQAHRVLELDLLDVTRQRPVPTRLYLPERASPIKPVPLVVFSHGLGGSRFGYQYLATYLADAGIASMHPQHVGSDHNLWRGNPLEMLPRLQAAARDAEAMARAQDVRFALDELLASVHAPLVDTSKIAVAGHSYGANTAMLVSGARVRTAELQEGTLKDTRIQAAILISAPPLIGQGPMEQVLSAVSIPTLHITSVDDTINLPGYRSTVDDRRAVFRAMRASPRTLAVFNAGGHSIFTDRTTRSGPETSARIKGATRELCSLFLEQSLLSPASDQGLRQWLVRYEDTLDQFVRQV